MHDEDLRRTLQRLPREAAPRELRQRIMARIDQQPAPGRRRVPALTAAIAAVAIAAGGWLGWQEWTQERRERLARQRLERLQLEYDDLQAELGELRRLVAESQPVVAVEGEGEYDFVLDLEALARSGRESAVPVAYRLPR